MLDTRHKDLPDWKNIHILIAEDDSSSFLVLDAILRPTGAHTSHALNGREAIDMCKKDMSIDLVLMDIQMPLMDGLSATGEIRKFRKNLPIIAQTAHASDEDGQNALKAGCNDYICKPINKIELLNTLQKYLSIH